jgi:sec-independent protein translocase protein TatB
MLQGGEIIIILLVALVVFGPQRLPELARRVGGWVTELRAAARDVRRGLESEVEELRSSVDDMRGTLEDVKKEIDEVGVSRLKWDGPKPVSGPTPEDAMRDLERIEREAALGEEE